MGVGHFRQKKAEILASLASSKASRGVARHLRELTAATDAELRRLWAQGGLDESATLIAVGGYGRGELFPHSDVDVLVLLPGDADIEANEGLKTALSSFITACWDAGLEIGSSVRTVAQCVQEMADVTVQTAMLESRLLCGKPELYVTFETAFTQAVDARAFFNAKLLEMRQRHTRFEDTPYALEPNCKESPGGLRDLHVILWMAKAAGFGSEWADLAQSGVATPLEVARIEANQAVLSQIRARLHVVAGRREDRLVFDLQTSVAESLGYTAKNGKRASEALMKRYYWAAKAVAQLNQILVLNMETRLFPSTHAPEPINARFNLLAGMVDVADDGLYHREPQAILETFYVYQTTLGAKGLSARTLRALYNARDVMDAKFRADPANRAMFLQILQQSAGITHALRLMNQTSVLGRTLWVFRRIVGQMQHDLFHVYTVDQHILMVVRNMRRFFLAEHAHEYPLCSQLASGFDRPWVLYAAALFHDIAKGRGGDHSQLGVREVRLFAKQFGVGKEDADLMAFLVAEHLAMSHTAQKEDLSDPDVIRGFAARVGNVRRLTALYLLTVADVRGTSPKVWNAWKGKLLESLYRYTLRALGGRATDSATWVEYRKREALKLVALQGLPHGAEQALWQSTDVSYFMRHDANDLAWHVKQLHEHVGMGRVVVRARLSPIGEGLQVLVYTPDQADLFARICGFMAQQSLSILDARVHTTKASADGQDSAYALDTFQVTSPDLAEHHREFIPMIEVELARVIESGGPLPDAMRARVSRRVQHFPVAPRVELRPDDKAQRWLLMVSATDRLGLLYGITRVLAKHRINLQLAKITTLGERVEDTFLIDGAELQHNKTQLDIETEVLAAISV
jgi:[protein-PII] uridylyltransferase